MPSPERSTIDRWRVAPHRHTINADLTKHIMIAIDTRRMRTLSSLKRLSATTDVLRHIARLAHEWTPDVKKKTDFPQNFFFP